MILAKEKWLFIGLMALIVLLTSLIFSMWVTYQSRESVQVRSMDTQSSGETDAEKAALDFDIYDRLVPQYKELVAPIEVNGIHKRIESKVLAAFSQDKSYTREAVEAIIYPLLEEDLSVWADEQAVSLFEASDITYNQRQLRDLTATASLKGHMEFMILYEVLFIKNKGINVID